MNKLVYSLQCFDCEIDDKYYNYKEYLSIKSHIFIQENMLVIIC